MMRDGLDNSAKGNQADVGRLLYLSEFMGVAGAFSGLPNQGQ